MAKKKIRNDDLKVRKEKLAQTLPTPKTKEKTKKEEKKSNK